MGHDRFDALAAAWDDHPTPTAIAADLFAFIQGRGLAHAQTRALDYGCGTGLLALRLAAACGAVLGLDGSEGMLGVAAQKIEALGFTNIRVAQHQFPRDPLPDEGANLITASMVLHHIEDVPGFLRAAAVLLPPGGACCFADLDTEDGGFHPEGVVIAHRGFDRETLKGWLQEAGFEAPVFETIREVRKGEQVYPIFAVYARRP